MKLIKEEKESRRLLMLIIINIFFTSIEIIYGLKYNSLSLVSDSVHMAFDCSGLIIGLYC